MPYLFHYRFCSILLCTFLSLPVANANVDFDVLVEAYLHKISTAKDIATVLFNTSDPEDLDSKVEILLIKIYNNRTTSTEQKITQFQNVQTELLRKVKIQNNLKSFAAILIPTAGAALLVATNPDIAMFFTELDHYASKLPLAGVSILLQRFINNRLNQHSIDKFQKIFNRLSCKALL